MAALMNAPCTLAAAQGARAQGPAIRARANAPSAAAVFGRRRQAVLTRSSRLVVSASGDEDADAELEKRLQKYTGTKDWKKEKAAEGTLPAASKGASSTDNSGADWGEETVFFEGPPSYGDLATNLVLGTTLLWLPLTLAAVGRSAWVYYKITDKRVSIKSTSPLNTNQLDASYAQMTEVRAIGRGLGYWGDMVIVLKDGSKLEIRSIDKWQEIKKYIEERMAEAQAAKEAGWAARKSSGGAASTKGFGGDN